MRGVYISPQHTSTRTILISMLEMTWIRRKRGELLHGILAAEFSAIFCQILYSQVNSVILSCRCDRILWYGRGLGQLSYVRSESRFSDHRPVYSVFSAEVESINQSRIQKMSCSSSQLDIEELLPYSYGYTDINPYGYTDLNFYWKSSRISVFSILWMLNPISSDEMVGLGERLWFLFEICILN